MFLVAKIEEDKCPSCKLQLKLQKIGQITYLELIFGRPKDSMKGKCYLLNGYKKWPESQKQITNDVFRS